VSLAACSTLHDALRAAARPRPKATAITFLDPHLRPTVYTFADLHAAADALADRLRACRLDPRAPVGILMESQESQVLHYLAVLACGLVPAVLTPPSRKFDHAYYIETMRGVLGHCGFGALITDLDALAPVARILRPYTLDDAGGSAAPIPVGDEVSRAAFLQFSSGTTGIKRGVLVSTRAVLAQMEAYASAIAMTPDDCVVSWLPLYHDMGFIAALNLPLALGASIVMLQPLDWVANPVLYLQAVSEYRGTLGWHPNFAFAFMAERCAADDLQHVRLDSLRGLVNASEPVTHRSQQRFLARFAPYGLSPNVFLGCYGMAEMTMVLTHADCTAPGYLDEVGPIDARATGQRRPFVSVGRPIDGVELRLVDEQGRALGDRRVGEIWARSPFLFLGYHNNPEATARVLAGDGWYRSGDLGFRVGDELFVCGRQKDLLIINGVNVYPQDVEDIVSQVPGVHAGRVVAFAVVDSRLDSDRIVVLAEPRDASGRDEWVVVARQHLAAALQLTAFDVYAVPSGSLVKSSAGKIARSENKRRWEAREAQAID